MFLAGGMSRLGLDAREAGNISAANSYGAAAASFVYIFTFVFGATWLTVPWLYPAEIFPLEVRAKGNAFGVVGWSEYWFNQSPSMHNLLTLPRHRQWMAYSAMPSHVQRDWRKDTVSQGHPLIYTIFMLTTYFPAISLVQQTSSQSPWYGLCTLRPTRGHLRYEHLFSLNPSSRIATDTLQEIDLLFEADSPWVWDAEKHFAKLLEENPNRVLAASRGNSVVDPEAGVKKADHADTASEERQEVAHVDNKE
jgi:hypothetical protein